MSNFNLKKLHVDGKSTASYTFYDLPGMPTVVCHPANKHNMPFFKGMLLDQPVMRFLAGTSIGEKDIDAATDSLARLYADHVIVSWSDMDGLTGEKDTKSTKVNKIKFITSLQKDASWVYDKFFEWAQNSKNFISLNEEVAEEKAKN